MSEAEFTGMDAGEYYAAQDFYAREHSGDSGSDTKRAEIRMITDIAAVAPKEILFNYAEVKAYLDEQLAVYRTMVVTEDQIPEAKSDRAKLNKLAKDIDGYRISVKKKLMEQYEADFAPKMKELAEIAASASAAIDEQIKAIENAEKQAKINAIRAEYDAMADAELTLYCPWEYVFNAKWANKGVSFDTAVAEIKSVFEQTKRDIKAIRDMGRSDTAHLLNKYRDSHDLSAVLEMAHHADMIAETVTTDAADTDDVPNIDTVTVTFCVQAPREVLIDLGAYMRAHGIKYWKPMGEVSAEG